MKINPFFNILILIFSAFFFVACGGGATGGPGAPGQGGSGGGVKQASQEDVKRALENVINPADKKSSILGKKIADTKGDIFYGVPENHPHGSAMMAVALTPYEQGFKVFFHQLLKDDPAHVCDSGYVVQKGQVIAFNRIADEQRIYVNNGGSSGNFYKGYIESGVTDSCGDYDKDTVWVVPADYLNGFDPSQPYTLIIDGVSGVDYDDLVKIEVSFNDKTDKTQPNAKYLGKKIGEGVTQIAYQRDYPSKKFGFNATITPYEKGFRILATSSDAQMCFGVDSEVYQDGARYEIETVADSWYEYFADNSGSPDGYIESGFFDSCTDLPLDTTVVIKSSRVGFNPKRPYTVKLGSVEIDPRTDERQSFEIKPQK